MGTKRLLYLALLGLTFVFYIAYGQWLSWIILLTVLGFPWLALLLSLPAMIQFRCAPAGPVALELGNTAGLWLVGSCNLPMPPFRGRLRLTHRITGESWLYQSAGDLPTDHCGGITVTMEKGRVCDYLGLFALPVRCRESKTILIRPRPVPMDLNKHPLRQISVSWKPKPGGGYAENHELRDYRPGDSLNQVHWKLSAKTGSLVLREAMEPDQGLILLTLNLRGSPEEIDRKLGRLLWLGNQLLQQEIRFELQCLTGDGILSFSIATEQALKKALDTLLCQPGADDGDLRSQELSAVWHCHIGGDADEP